MQRTPSGKIRKLVCGENPRDFAMAFQVGSPFKNGDVITEIVEDVNHFFIFGKIRFLIYLLQSKKDPFLWKAVEGVPVVIEYFSPDEKEINIV